MADKVLVYELSGPEQIGLYVGTLRAVLAPSFPVVPATPEFSVSPVSGAFRWIDPGLKRKGGSGELPRSSQEAAAVALEFFRKVNGAAAKYRTSAQVAADVLPDPFPEGLRHIETEKIQIDTKTNASAWLSRWVLYLPWSGSAFNSGEKRDRAPVWGASVDVIVGRGNAISSVVSNVRPWRAVRRAKAYAYHAPHPHPANQGHQQEGHHQQESVAPSVIYILEGPREPQQFLSPFYAMFATEEEPHSHEPMATPACSYSLIIEVAVAEQPGGALLLAAMVMTEGGTMVEAVEGAAWEVRWFVVSFANFTSSGGVTNTGSQFRLTDPGIYHVELAVRNRRTGAARTTFTEVSVGVPSARQLVA